MLSIKFNTSCHTKGRQNDHDLNSVYEHCIGPQECHHLQAMGAKQSTDASSYVIKAKKMGFCHGLHGEHVFK